MEADRKHSVILQMTFCQLDDLLGILEGLDDPDWYDLINDLLIEKNKAVLRDFGITAESINGQNLWGYTYFDPVLERRIIVSSWSYQGGKYHCKAYNRLMDVHEQVVFERQELAASWIRSKAVRYANRWLKGGQRQEELPLS